MIATAIANEKENKTLETLLSVPIPRSILVSSKMVAAGIIALIAAVVYMFGVRYYFQGVAGGELSNISGDSISGALQQLGLILTPFSYVVLVTSLFLGILCALSIAVILGAFAESVKNVQALISPLMVMVVIPYFFVMFLDINSLSPVLKYFIYAIPFSHPFMASPNLLLQNYNIVFFGIAYQLVFFLVFVYIAGRIFSSDKILTMKLKLKKTK